MNDKSVAAWRAWPSANQWFFWGSFIERWKKELNLPHDANPDYYYDLDWIVTVPNMDPRIRPFETIRENKSEVVVKTGFMATLRKKYDFPMPEFISFWKPPPMVVDQLHRILLLTQ